MNEFQSALTACASRNGSAFTSATAASHDSKISPNIQSLTGRVNPVFGRRSTWSGSRSASALRSRPSPPREDVRCGGLACGGSRRSWGCCSRRGEGPGGRGSWRSRRRHRCRTCPGCKSSWAVQLAFEAAGRQPITRIWNHERSQRAHMRQTKWKIVGLRRAQKR